MLMTQMPLSKIILVATLATFVGITGCAKKKPLPNSASQLGLGNNNSGSAQPGSAQDFTVNVGDRIFFTTDSTSLTAKARGTLDKTSRVAWQVFQSLYHP